jgi:hypothetical protein
MVWMTPIFPFSIPPTTLPSNATQKLVEKPTISNESIVPAQPMRRIGFRPTRSDRDPQKKPVRASERFTDMETLDQEPGVRKDGCQGNRFGDSDQCWNGMIR